MKMKKIILSVLPFFILLGCNQEENDVQLPSIYGTWQLIESYNVSGSGVSGEWREVPNEDKYEFTIAFNNTFSSTRYSDCSRGNVKYDDAQITFNYGCEGFTLIPPEYEHPPYEYPSGVLSYNYHIDGNKLSFYPYSDSWTCYEMWGDTFQKIAEMESRE